MRPQTSRFTMPWYRPVIRRRCCACIGTVAPLLHRSLHERLGLMRTYADLRATIIQDHARVFDAIAARDEVGAEAIMRRHFAIGDEYRRRAATAEAAP